ncbi:hypothetical protein D3C80_1352120 [compost metagenome]
MNKSHDGSDNPHSRGVPACSFKNFGIAFIFQLFGVHIQLQNLAYLVRIGAVNDKQQPFTGKRIGMLLRLLFQCKNTAPPCNGCHRDQLLDLV